MTTTNEVSRRALATALLIFPCLFILVFLLHFRHPADFFFFFFHYSPRAPEQVVGALIRGQNRYPLVHDQHILAYLSLPLMPLCAFAMYIVGRARRPLASAASMFITVTCTIYLGGIFGMWTAFYRGLGSVDPSQTEGAIATFKAMTANQGAFLLTTTLGKLSMIGLAAQALTLWGRVNAWAIACILSGAVLFLLFWDLDNWMTVAMLLILIGFVPVRRALVKAESAAGLI